MRVGFDPLLLAPRPRWFPYGLYRTGGDRMSERYSPGTCLTIWAVLAALSWIGAAYFIAFVANHLPKGIAL